MKACARHKSWLALSLLSALSMHVFATDLIVNFKDADIQQFIDVSGRNINKIIMVDPTISGVVNVQADARLTSEQYYPFFLNVLAMHGYAVVDTAEGFLKVLPDEKATFAGMPIVEEHDLAPDNVVITRVIPVNNVSVIELSPVLRQYIDHAGAENVVHFDATNIIILSGHAPVVNRLAEIVKQLDVAGDVNDEIIAMHHASAHDVVQIIERLNDQTNLNSVPSNLKLSIAADERTNSILISGERIVRERLKKLIYGLDQEVAVLGNNRVIYLHYAKAADIAAVLKVLAETLVIEKKGGKTRGYTDTRISFHKETNALVIAAPPDVMRSFEKVVAQLDIRRAQVLIEAMIVEVAENDGARLGGQFGSLINGGVQFTNTDIPVTNLLVAQEQQKDTVSTESLFDNNNNLVDVPVTTPGDPSAIADALGHVSGLAVGVMMGDWTALVTAVSNTLDSNILSSPSLMVLDNEEASLIVGEEVPVITGSKTNADSSNAFQTVERKDVGLKLTITPQINEGDSVLLNIQQEISNVMGASGAVDLRFGKREITTSVLASDQQMIVLSGLIDERTQESEQKIPLLGDIPWFGRLFKSTATVKEKRNLMLFIKPTIIRSGIDADALTQRKYNFIRAEQMLRRQEDTDSDAMADESAVATPIFEEANILPAEIRPIMVKLR